MNQLKCEMCGSTDLVKQDGMLVCQVCGTRYSVEEAKKMIIDGTVDVQGTVKVDISDELAKLYKVARNAREDGNVEDAIRCYNDILRKDPTSWEATFYVCFITAGHCKLGEVESAATRISTCTKSVLRLIKENVESKEEQIVAVKEIATRCTAISEVLFKFAKQYTGGAYLIAGAQYNQQNINGCCAARDIMYDLGNAVEIIFNDYPELHLVSVEAWKSGIAKHRMLMPLFSKKDLNKKLIAEYEKKIEKYEPTYQSSENQSSNDNKTGHCYIATCVYGSYDCPQVWALRRYRDYTLGSSRCGRAFIRCYYAVSPTVVKWFGHANWFHKFWRKKLDKKVQRLREQGVEDTPYADIEWRKSARQPKANRT